jgi:ribosomal 50S subunit-associated protein YjgA (DUF615 family)
MTDQSPDAARLKEIRDEDNVLLMFLRERGKDDRPLFHMTRADARRVCEMVEQLQQQLAAKTTEHLHVIKLLDDARQQVAKAQKENEEGNRNYLLVKGMLAEANVWKEIRMDDAAEDIVSRDYIDEVLSKLEPYRQTRASAFGDILESEMLHVARLAFVRGQRRISARIVEAERVAWASGWDAGCASDNGTVDQMDEAWADWQAKVKR